MAGTAGVGVMIGEAGLTDGGWAARAGGRRPRRRRRPADAHAEVVMVEEANPSWRAFEKAGFRHVLHVEEDGVPHRLTGLDRPA